MMMQAAWRRWMQSITCKRSELEMAKVIDYLRYEKGSPNKILLQTLVASFSQHTALVLYYISLPSSLRCKIRFAGYTLCSHLFFHLLWLISLNWKSKSETLLLISLDNRRSGFRPFFSHHFPDDTWKFSQYESKEGWGKKPYSMPDNSKF